jgi:DNA-3-methyladenine glycosylase II/AraC family transcriptional regulator of adaptative response / DNA-3-methyladenine glycosylase II
MGFDHRVTSTLVDLRALRAFLVAHAVAGLDEVEVLADGSSRHRRLVRVRGGHAVVSVTLPAGDVGTPHIHADDGLPDAVPPAVAAGRRWVGLDADPSAGATDLADDPRLGPLVAARPHLRVPGSTDAFETAVTVVLGQHVSLAAGRLFAARLVAAHAPPARVGSLRSFPDPETLAALDPAALQRTVGITRGRARSVVAIARAVTDGTLDLAPTTDGGLRTTTRAALLALPGVGPWTADLVALRALRDPDVFLPGDLVLRKALGGVTAREAAAAAEAWSPHRSLAVLHLWTHHAIDPRPAGRADVRRTQGGQ